jgi:DNA polymerase I
LADRNSIAIPRTRRGGRAEKIEGGYVHDVESGLYPWIAVLDFKSMYPSIMIHNNICYTTRIDALRTDELPQGIEAHESPSGARFLPEKVRRGIVPQLLQKLMLQRDAHKQLMRAAKVAEDIDEMYFHDRMQAAVKVLMNSFYGVFASAFYRFTHPQLGAAITAWARSNIKELIAQLESEGIPVVYSDTDSLFASAPVAADAPKSPPDSDASSEENAIWQATVAQLIEFGTDLATRLSDSGAELEFETGLAMFFSHGAKKRYFGRVVWPEPELLIRGYETRRTDSFDLLTATMMEVFEMILNDDSSAAVQHVIELIRSLRGREVDPSRLIISRGCKGRVRPDGSVDFSVYDNPDGLPFVQAARKRLEQGLAFTPGMKVGWVVTNARNRPMVVEPWIESETGVAVDTYDPEFYANRLAIAMGRITDAFGWSSKDLLSGTRQATFDFF